MTGYLYGPGTGVKTAAELQREREIVDALIARGQRPPQNLGEGLSTLGQAIASRLRRKRLEKDEGAAKEAGTALLSDLFPVPDSPTIAPEPEIQTGPIGGGMSSYQPAPSLAGSAYPTSGPETPPGPADWQQGDMAQAQPVPEPMPTAQTSFPKTTNNLENMSADQLTRFMADPRFEHMPPMVQQMVAEEFKRKSAPVDPMDALNVEEKQLQIERLRNPPPEKPTSDIQEYQFYMQEAQQAGQQPVDFYTWQKSKTPQTTITNSIGGEVGTIPQGFELFTDPKSGGRSMRPIAGGPAALEQQQYNEKMSNRELNKATVGEDVVISNIDQALKLSDSWLATGALGQMTRGIGGTPAAQLKALIDPIKANIGFDRLQQMRQDSPTGGALGQVAVQELDMLQATLGSLDPNAGPEILTRNIKLIKTLYQRALERNAMYGKNKTNPPTNQSAPDLKKKYGLE